MAQNRPVLPKIGVTLEDALPAGGWTLARSYGGSVHGTSQGAELWVSSTGRRVIVKHHPEAPIALFEAIGQRIEMLRTAGVPAPVTTVAQHGADVLLIHDYLPGRSDPVLTPSLIDDLVDIVERERGLADDSATQWPELIQKSLTTGIDGRNEHASLESFSADSRELLQRVRRVGRDPSVRRLTASDLVHCDLHTVNILSVDGRRVSGIIDWDGIRAGDRAIDLAKLAFTSLWKTHHAALHEQIWHAFLSSSNHDSRVVYMHDVVLGQVNWVIRHAGMAPGPARTLELSAWALAVTERDEFSPPPRS